MQDLSHIELSDLYDMLAQQTSRYMKMLSDGATRQEFNQCRETIISVQTEIQTRKGPRGHQDNRPGSFANDPGS